MNVISPLYAVVGFLVVQRLAELVLARRNHRALLARGAIEVGERHYNALVSLHAGWLLALLVTVDPRASVSIPWLLVFGLLQGGRIWVIATLGTRWTTRAWCFLAPRAFAAGALAVVGSVLNLLPRPQPAAETPRADR